MKMTGIGKETTEYLQKELHGVIHPWQYKDSDIHIVNIDSVLSDVISNWQEDIRFRQGFNINEDNSLNIPTMFVQINGIYTDKNKYREFLDSMETNKTIRFKNTKNMFLYDPNIEEVINLDYNKRKKYLLRTRIDSFETVNEFAEKLLYTKFREFVEKYPELNSVVYAKIMNLDSKILNLLQNFDYCFKNPKIMVENMDDKNFDETDKYVLIYLYSLGFDIIIFSPKGLSFLKNYKINTITLDNYLNQDVDNYDYRTNSEILKEKKQLEKKEKKEKIELL